ncbi:HTH-type transcriptional repressor RspR [bacterium HR26]|nr:HTH-type transcriptional repressor RspR [bacterium HR26]
MFEIEPIADTSVYRSDEAYERLKRAIVRGRLPPGVRLRESELAARLGVSRTPVREALRRLAVEGLVRLQPGRTAVVADLDPAALRDLYSVRAVLEGMAARDAAHHAAPPVLGLLGGIIAQMAEALERGDDEQLEALNAQFHLALAQASGNRYLMRLLMEMEPQVERFRFVALRDPARRKRSYEEHFAIYAAVRDHDADRAEQAARHHVERALAWRLARDPEQRGGAPRDTER